MLTYRKAVDGQWRTMKLTQEEAKKVQAQVLRIGLSLHKNMQELIKTANLIVSDVVMAQILAKAMPSYDSLANDVIEAGLTDKPKSEVVAP